MKLTCFITVCACLSSTVFADEIKHLNRIKKIARSQEELAVKDVTARKEINPIPEISDIFPKSRQFQPQTRIEKPKRNHEFRSESQQQQQHRYNRGYSRNPTRHIKTRSIVGSSTRELNDNRLDSIPDVIHDEGPIRIEPVFRVTTKKNGVFDSIVDILHQLLDPPKNELGPLVPIQMPGSKRKIYLRLIEPLDSSQVMVRFVTQLAVPVIDAEKQMNPFIPIPSIIDPTAMLLNHAHHGTVHPVVSGDALFASSSNRHHVVYPPRNVSYAKGLQSTKLLIKNPQNSSKNQENKGSSSPAIPPNKAESDKNRLTDMRNLQNYEQQLLSESAASYYQYQAAGEEVMNKVKELLAKENATLPIESEGDSKSPSVEPWYQLSTHRLPFRQIAPHPLAPMEPSSSSYADTYKVPSDVLTGPSSSYSTSYEQYNDAINSASGFYPSSYNAPNSYSTSYKQNEIHDTHPSTYRPITTSYHKQNEFNNAPSSYSNSYQNQNEFNGAPSFYSGSYQSQNEFYSAPSSYAASYEKQNNLFNGPSAYSNSHEKPNVQFSPNSYEKQVAASSNNALRVIDPPSYLPGYRTENQTNRTFESTTTAIRHPRYNSHGITDSSNTAGEPASQVIWGKSKRQKSESSFEKITGAGIDDNRGRWQPVVFVHENADWHDAYEAELAKIAATERQPLFEDRSTRKPSREGADQSRRNNKHRGGAIARNPRCSTASGEQNECERSRSTTVSTPRSESTVRIVEKQTQSAVNSESITVVKSTTSNTIETLQPNVTAKSPTAASVTKGSSQLMTTTESPKSMSGNGTTKGSSLSINVIKSDSTTTEKPPGKLLMKAIENVLISSMAERLVATEASVIKPTVNVMQKSTNQLTSHLKSNTIKKSSDTIKISSGTTEKSIGTTEKSSDKSTEKSLTNGAIKISISSDKTRKLELSKRPMVMKKAIYIMKRPELNSTTRTVTTQKPMISSTTKGTTVARKSKFSRTISKAKSSTT
ncbi:NK-tumor recognition protein-like [Cataglyphis hispanica]|uniref:NK-tumor recognition protein-like n=1 Tax=Cataglyphis hispanica TaxID=1086592 RepID=UPI00217F46D5|nr:NK-tumor recognition protein-like [Cataglyphis hispanica]